MSIPLTAPAVLDREFLQIRAKILELAASFDRFDRGDGSVDDDPRLRRIQEALDVLRESKTDRAEQIQLVFSRAYEDDWQKQFGM